MFKRSFLLLALTVGQAQAAPPASPTSRPNPAVSADWVQRVQQRRDAAKRQAALSEVRAALVGTEPAKQVEALRALGDVNEINFDHGPFESPVHRLISSPDAAVRVAALNVLPSYGPRYEDLATLVTLANDPSSDVRIAVPKTYVAINGRVADAAFDAMLLKLLSDPDPRVQRGALNAMARVPVGPRVEARLIEMSRDPNVRRDRSLNRDVVIYGLTTRPTITVPMSQRLIDLLLDPPDEADFQQRVTYAFRTSDVEPAAQPAVVDALVTVFHDTLNSGMRDNCIAALGKIGNDAALNALADIATDPAEDDRTRQAAARAMQPPP